MFIVDWWSLLLSVASQLFIRECQRPNGIKLLAERIVFVVVCIRLKPMIENSMEIYSFQFAQRKLDNTLWKRSVIFIGNLHWKRRQNHPYSNPIHSLVCMRTRSIVQFGPVFFRSASTMTSLKRHRNFIQWKRRERGKRPKPKKMWTQNLYKNVSRMKKRKRKNTDRLQHFSSKWIKAKATERTKNCCPAAKKKILLAFASIIKKNCIFIIYYYMIKFDVFVLSKVAKNMKI